MRIIFLLLICLSAQAQIVFTGNQQWAGQNAFGAGSPPVSGGSSSPGIFATNFVTSTGTKTTNTVAAVPANSFLVLCVGNEAAQQPSTAVTSSISGLTFTLRNDATTLANSGSAQQWTTFFAAGGDIRVTNTIGGAAHQAAMLYVFTNTEGSTFTGALAKTNNTTSAMPSVVINVGKTGSTLVVVDSDFAAKSGSRTFVPAAPTSQEQSYFQDGTSFTEFDWIIPNASSGNLTVGMTAPTGQAAGFCVLEVKGP